MDEELLNILACPACLQKLTLLPGGTGLACAQCAKVYPVEDGIPVLLMEEAVDQSAWEARTVKAGLA